MDPLETTLHRVAQAMAPARHAWWIITSAACWLHGIDPGEVRDVDVLMDERDHDAVLTGLGLNPEKGSGDELFRSRCFVRWGATPLPVEFFAGFELREAYGWREITLTTREWRRLGEVELPVQAKSELAALLRRFGRPKDLARAELLSPSGPFPSR
jgi:hypothetical protein